MKTRVACLWIMASMIRLAGVSEPSSSASIEQTNPSLQGAMLELRSSASSYVLGELIKLEISVTDISAATISLPAGVDVWEGHVEVLLAYEDEPFKKYRGPGWGLRDTTPRDALVLQSGKTLRTNATMLYNHGVETKHLNKRLAGEIAASHIEDGYALTRPGRYRLKALLHGNGFEESIESQATEIHVGQPQGADRAAWAVLKNDSEYGYFIQAGGPKGHPAAPRSQQIIAVLERVFGDYPESRYAEPVGVALAKYRDTFARLAERGLIQQGR